MQFFLDEDGSCRFECISGVDGAKLEMTYQGAHINRPADIIDVDEFVGVKSCKAKGKRLSTFDIATLRFIEPEVVEEPADEEPTDIDVEPTDEMVDVEEVVEDIQPVDNSNTPMEIIRNNIDEGSGEQLNLF